jgi:hypothetical protein
VFLDQCVHHPLLYFPVFYSLKAAVAGKSILESLELYKNNFFEDMVSTPEFIFEVYAIVCDTLSSIYLCSLILLLFSLFYFGQVSRVVLVLTYHA